MLNSYVTDMLALEAHIEKAVGGQLSDLDGEEPEFAAALEEAHEVIASHITHLGLVAEARGITGGGAVAEKVKTVVSKVAGLGAAAIDFVRHEKLPKDIRDDYAAFRLAEVGYDMLHTSASVLDDDEELRELALEHMRDYADLAAIFRDLAPAAVLRYLEKDGCSVSDQLLARVLEEQRQELTTR
jgi:hypothetical protein